MLGLFVTEVIEALYHQHSEDRPDRRRAPAKSSGIRVALREVCFHPPEEDIVFEQVV